MIVTLKKIKTFPGHEGTALDCDLAVDGVVTAHFHDAGDGGGPLIHPVPGQAEQFDALEAAIKVMPPKPVIEAEERALWPDGMPVDLDLLVWEAFDANERMKEFRRWCRTQTCYRLTRDELGSYRCLKTIYTEKVGEQLRGRFPQLEEILNETVAGATGKAPTFTVPDW